MQNFFMVLREKISAIPDWVFVFFLILLALSVRIMYHSLHPLITRDGIYYVNLIQEWYLQGDGFFTKYVRIQPPLFPYLSRVLMFTGLSAERAALIVNMGAGSLLIVPVYYSGKVLYREKAAAVWLALLACVLPPLVQYSCTLIRESLYFFFLFLIFFLWICAFKGICRKWNTLLCAFFSVFLLYCRYEGGEVVAFAGSTLAVHALLPGWKWKKFFQTCLLFLSGVISGSIFLLLLPGMPDIIQIYAHRIWMQCLGTFINPL